MRSARTAWPFAAMASLALAQVLPMGCSSSGNIAGLTDTGGIRLVVFSSDRNQSVGQFDVMLWDVDEQTFRSVDRLNSPSASDRHPNLSSDGRFIAFQSERGSSQSDIYVYDRVNGTYVDVPGMNTSTPETEPIFTGDGLKLAYTQGSTARRIRLYNGQAKQLIPLPGLDTTGVVWSDEQPGPNQDGSLIAFVSTRNGNPDVFVYNRTQQRVLDLPVLRSGSDDIEPVMSPDGRLVVFSSNRGGGPGGGYDLYMYDFMDSTLRALPAVVNTVSDERHPAISANTNVIVFQSNRTDGLGKWDVWNFERSSNRVGQGAGYSSSADDVDPGVRWPY